MPSGAISQVFRSLSDVPLGQGEGEQSLLRPYNAAPMTVLSYVRNWSAIKKRRTLREAISWLHGGQAAVGKGGPYANSGMSIQALREEAGRGIDVSLYNDPAVHETDVVLTFDGRKYVIPARDAEGNAAPKTLVPEGLVDLYAGNWDRMHSSDARERGEELSKLSARVRNLRCEGPEDDTNPDGFLEFIREEVRPQVAAMNDARVYAASLPEV